MRTWLRHRRSLVLFSFASGTSRWILASSNGGVDSFYEEKESSARPGVSARRVRPKRPKSVRTKVETRRVQAEARHAAALQDDALLSNVQFAERADLHLATKRAITEQMGFQTMTEIQAKTYAAAISGKNVLGRSKTGSGKSLAFLLPTVERLLQGHRDLYIPGQTIGALIVAPTRELAIQITEEANRLLNFHDMAALCVYGGTKTQRDVGLFTRQIPALLVGTPGRLLLHTEHTRIRGRRFADILKHTKIVVLDEMDLLLDLGFQKDIKKILSHLPRAGRRQTLLFSATVPNKMRVVLDGLLGADYVYVDCVGDNGKQNATNIRAQQTWIRLDHMQSYVSTLVQVVFHAMKETPDYKVVVFFPATKIVAFFAEVFRRGLGMNNVVALHSRMSQSSRQRASEEFRTRRRSILLTSDVSARGVDYPDVTHVIQYGSADSRDTYIHRVGRTARMGKVGKGILVLLPFEHKLIPDLQGSGISKATLPPPPKELEDKIRVLERRMRSSDKKFTDAAELAYQAFLSYYIANLDDTGALSAQDVVRYANQFVLGCGISDVPKLPEKIVRKLGLDLVDGIVATTRSRD